MGVSGSGKSTVAAALAKSLGWRFAEGDDFHPPANIAKMKSGHPLDDADRMPWLASIAAWIAQCRQAGEPAIVTCSALKRSYRDLLVGGAGDVLFVYLKGAMEVVSHHLEARVGHFMPPSLLPTQFETLEEPGADENCVTMDASASIPAIVAEIEAFLMTKP